MPEINDYTAQNRRAWNEIAAVRATIWPDAAFFAAGGTLLEPEVLAAAGDVRGQTILHLQCATGEDTLSWAVAGAQATGVDLSDAQIALAVEKAAAAGLAVRFVAADLYALPDDLQQGSFDYVYTGGGALVWLPDLDRWAATIVRALRPGGRLLLAEEHPVAGCLWIEDDQLQITADYFGRGTPDCRAGWSHFPGAEDAGEMKAEFSWPLGDVVTALAQAGLRIERLTEYPSVESWRFGNQLEQVAQLPGEYVLIARKDRS
jgi:SAM-dependent methyltransferase